MTSSFINPSSLSASPSPSYNSPSPSPSTSAQPLPSTSSQPPRKRPRSEVTSEERKEARAHRNRIAAQNSRDRRKAQFVWLERRVAELEDENRRLRAGLPLPPAITPSSVPLTAPVTQVVPIRSPEEEMRAAREKERERENEELKERIKTLERGWDAVVKALAAQGLPTGLSPSENTTVTANTATPTPTNTNTASSASNSSASPSALTQTPSSSLNQYTTAFPSPAPSELDLEFSNLSSSATPAPLVASPTLQRPQNDDVSTRHLARVATIESPRSSMSLQRVDSSSHEPSADNDDDAKMEDLFREILVDAATVALGEGNNADGDVQAAAPFVTPKAASASKEVNESGSKRKREEEEEEEEPVAGAHDEKKEELEGKNTKSGIIRGMDLGLGINTANDFGASSFDWTTTSPTTPFSPEDMQRMLDEMEMSAMLPSMDLDLGLGMDLGNFASMSAGAINTDMGMWNSTMAGVF